MAPRSQQRGEEGYVLLLVLLGLTLISAIAAALIQHSRHAAEIAGARSGAIEAGLLAEAGLARALQSIDEIYASDVWPENGTPTRFAFAGGEITVSIRDEAGKTDLVSAPELMVGAVLSGAGVSSERRTQILSALRQARLESAMHNRAFSPVSLEAFGRAVGLTRAELEAIRTDATVHSGLGGFDPLVASPELVRAVPGQADNPVQASLKGPARADMPNRAPLASPAFMAVSPRQMFTVHAEACTANKELAVREAIYVRERPGKFSRLELREPWAATLLANSCTLNRPNLATHP